MAEAVGMVLSTAGHDRGTRYLVLQKTDAAVLLTDGKLRKLDRPKRKNRKHVRFLPDSDLEAVSGKLSRPLTDASVRRALAEAARLAT